MGGGGGPPPPPRAAATAQATPLQMQLVIPPIRVCGTDLQSVRACVEDKVVGAAAGAGDAPLPPDFFDLFTPWLAAKLAAPTAPEAGQLTFPSLNGGPEVVVTYWLEAPCTGRPGYADFDRTCLDRQAAIRAAEGPHPDSSPQLTVGKIVCGRPVFWLPVSHRGVTLPFLFVADTGTTRTLLAPSAWRALQVGADEEEEQHPAVDGQPLDVGLSPYLCNVLGMDWFTLSWSVLKVDGAKMRAELVHRGERPSSSSFSAPLPPPPPPSPAAAAAADPVPGHAVKVLRAGPTASGNQFSVAATAAGPLALSGDQLWLHTDGRPPVLLECFGSCPHQGESDLRESHATNCRVVLTRGPGRAATLATSPTFVMPAAHACLCEFVMRSCVVDEEGATLFVRVMAVNTGAFSWGGPACPATISLQVGGRAHTFTVEEAVPRLGTYQVTLLLPLLPWTCAGNQLVCRLICAGEAMDPPPDLILTLPALPPLRWP